MMTIKEFASLCGCNPQTLRYYDRIGLLKPTKVDQWSGYRYYEKSQALDYVKIRNLQAADFTIGEIKVLLPKTDQEVYEAFARKIRAQEQKLGSAFRIQPGMYHGMGENCFDFGSKEQTVFFLIIKQWF